MPRTESWINFLHVGTYQPAIKATGQFCSLSDAIHPSLKVLKSHASTYRCLFIPPFPRPFPPYPIFGFPFPRIPFPPRVGRGGAPENGAGVGVGRGGPVGWVPNEGLTGIVDGGMLVKESCS